MSGLIGACADTTTQRLERACDKERQARGHKKSALRQWRAVLLVPAVCNQVHHVSNVWCSLPGGARAEATVFRTYMSVRKGNACCSLQLQFTLIWVRTANGLDVRTVAAIISRINYQLRREFSAGCRLCRV